MNLHTQLINLESEEWHIAHIRSFEEESKLIEVVFEYVRYRGKISVAVYRKRN